MLPRRVVVLRARVAPPAELGRARAFKGGLRELMTSRLPARAKSVADAAPSMPPRVDLTCSDEEEPAAPGVAYAAGTPAPIESLRRAGGATGGIKKRRRCETLQETAAAARLLKKISERPESRRRVCLHGVLASWDYPWRQAWCYSPNWNRVDDLETLVAAAGAQINVAATPAGSTALQLAVTSGQDCVLRELIDAGALLHILQSSQSTPVGSRVEAPQRVDVLYIAIACAEAECLKVLLDTGMESRAHSDAALLETAGSCFWCSGADMILGFEHQVTDQLFNNHADDADFDADSEKHEYEVDEIKWDIEDDASESVQANIRTMVKDHFQARALVQAYRRLALSSGAGCVSRLATQSPLRYADADVFDHLLTAHLLVGKPRMPGAPVSAAILARFAEQNCEGRCFDTCTSFSYSPYLPQDAHALNPELLWHL